MTLLPPATHDFSTRALALLESPPVPGLRSASRAAVGCGIGLIVASKIRNDTARQTTAITLLSLGLIVTLPGVVNWVLRTLDRPETERGSRRRLRSIREGIGLDPADELF